MTGAMWDEHCEAALVGASLSEQLFYDKQRDVVIKAQARVLAHASDVDDARMLLTQLQIPIDENDADALRAEIRGGTHEDHG